jgi:drug/metabolite transporter (DMT)-like permease
VSLGRDVVILACAVSAGIHGALVPAHLAEGTGAGAGFVAATVLLGSAALWLTVRPADPRPLTAAAIVLAGLLGAYVLATTTGVPVLHPTPEPVDGLALATKAIETLGLLTAAALLSRRAPAPPALIHPKGTPT